MYEQKFELNQHWKTLMHKAKYPIVKLISVQQSVKAALHNIGDETVLFHQDMCKALFVENISFNKLEKVLLRVCISKE